MIRGDSGGGGGLTLQGTRSSIGALPGQSLPVKWSARPSTFSAFDRSLM